jgi:predicted Ser/Thr protein kinase
MLTVGELVGGFRVERVLGRGGMGVVYEATQVGLERRVALKVLPTELTEDPVFRERFRREGVLQAALEHPHILSVYEAGEAEGRLFLAMRLIRGPTLKQLVGAGELDDARALRLLTSVANALDAAHAARLVHRDVKPQNVLVDERDHPYLADFGLVRAPDTPSLTATGQFVGTPHYIAPEQIQGRPATAASDIYAFAAMVFECLTGSVPYQRASQAAVLWAHVHEPAPRVTALRRDLPPAVDEVIARGMAKDPGQRHESATVLVAEAMERIAASPGRRTATVTAPGGPAPGGPVARSRRRLGVALTTAAAAGVVVVFIVSGLDREPAGRERDAFRLGSALRVPMRETFHCANDDETPCVVVQTRLPGRTIIAPRDGKVRQWQVKNAKGTFRLVVLRRAAGRWAVVAHSDPVTVSARGVSTVAADDLAIHKGDAIGLDMGPRATVGWYYEFLGADFARWTQLGSVPQKPEGTGPANYEMALTAYVKP